jgi:hypothetical protein
VKPPRILDGALGTTLAQRLTLPAGTPTAPLNRTHPDAVRAVHAAHRAAGATLLRTNTLTCAPGVHEAWQQLRTLGVDLARQAARDADVWLSTTTLPGVATGIGALPIDGVLVETVMALDAGLATLRAIQAEWDGPVAMSFVPGPATAALTPRRVAALRAEGVQLALNCAPAAAVHAALDVLPAGAWWVWPSDATVDDLLGLADRASGIGGCCGTGPSCIAGFRDRTQGTSSSTS